MNLIIAPDITQLFPMLRIGVVTCRDINNQGVNPAVTEIKRNAAENLRQRLSPEALNQHPFITAWRETYRRFGDKPKDHRPTAEALLRRIVRGEDIPTISTAVDLYLAIETEYYLPIGGYDLDHIVGDITLRLSPGDEPFTPIGATQPTETTYAGEVVYADAEKILTRRWNYRDCDAAKILPESRNIALFSEATLPDIPTEHLEASMRQLADYLRQYCGGDIAMRMLAAQEQQTIEM